MWLVWGATTLRKTGSQLAAKQRQLVALEQAQPAPTQAVADALEADIAAARLALREAEALWRDNAVTRALSARPGNGEATAAAPPLTRRAAYFDLARYRQDMIRLAQGHGVELSTEPHFGFSDYANEGPAEADILRVYKQRLVLEQVVGALLHSRPQRLLAVSRASADADSPAATVAAWGEVNASNLGLRAEGSRAAFQIRFRGRTAALRDWLNALARARLPVVVRSITVEPAAERQRVPGGAGLRSSLPAQHETAEDGFELLARPTDSDFLVTLDYVEFSANEAEPDRRAAATGEIAEPAADTDNATPVDNTFSPPQWAAAQPQRRGAQWLFDLFTPPEIFYHAESRQFRVTAAQGSAEGPVASAALALAGPGRDHVPRLLELRYEDYPLQVSGYLSNGAGEAPIGLFENLQNGETLLLRSGDQVPSLGVEILALQVEAAPEPPERMTLRPPRATATIRAATGEQLILREGERAKGHRLVARLEMDGQNRDLREGETWQSPDGHSLEVEKIEPVPSPRVLLKHHRPDGSPPETTWLELDSPQ